MRRVLLQSCRIFAFAAVVWLATSPLAWADRVGVVGGIHDGYGRIVFNWESPVRYEATINDGRLEIRFGRRIEADYDRVLRVLRNYLGDERDARDGRGISFALKGAFTLRNFDLGTAVVVDLLNQRPATAATGPTSDAPITVRSGEHDGFTRVVFDWPSRVAYKVAREGDKAKITFGRPALFDLSTVNGDRWRYLRRATAVAGTPSAQVELTVADGAGLRDFRSGTRIGFDITAPEPMAPPSAPEIAEDAASSSVQIARQAPPTAEPAPEASQPVTTDLDVPAPRGLTPQREETSPDEAQSTESASLSRPTPLIPSRPRSLQPLSRPEPTEGVGAGRPVAVPTTPVEETAPGEEPVVSEETAIETGMEGADAADVAVQPAPTVESVTLRFDWTEQTGAAVFRRGNAVWAVFDRPSARDVAELGKTAGNLVRRIDQFPNDGFTVMRFETIVSGVNPGLRRDGLDWILEFRDRPAQPETAIEVRTQAQSAVGPRVMMPVVEPAQPLVVTDPDIGDNLIVVPVVPLGHGIGGLHQYPQFDLLPTVQGVVILSRIDRLEVNSRPQGIEITRNGGLMVSDVSVDDEAAARLAEMVPRSRAIEVGVWSYATVGNFNEALQGLQLDIVAKPSDKRERPRLELARFFLANGFEPEALGVLGVIADARPEIAEEADFRAMRGAARMLMGRLNEAAEDFDHPSLEGIDEATFWRAALKAADRDYGVAADGFKESEGIVYPYPNVIKMPLGMLAARTAVETGDVKRATTLLESLKAAEPTAAELNHLKFIEGRLKELSGQPDEAIILWEEVERAGYQPSRTMAVLARTDLLMKEGRIDPQEAIQNLESQRFAWRGDDLEFDLLRRLGDLYLETGDYRNGLRTLRQAATNFREHEDTPAVTQKMTDVFARLYLDGEADSLPPVSAIALYDEFRELTPAGERGDEMIRRLADRMVSVDLLGQAAELLDAQVQFRLQGVERARVGARLALVYMFDQQADTALSTLDASDVPDIPEELEMQRRHLRARALSDLSREDEALALLDTDESRDATILRAEIHSKIGNWTDAAKALADLVKESGAEPGSPLDVKQESYILNLAIALTLSGDDEGVRTLRTQFRSAMDDGDYRDAFRLIAEPKTEGLLDYRQVADQVSEVKNFQEFMASYRELLQTRNLSAIN